MSITHYYKLLKTVKNRNTTKMYTVTPGYMLFEKFRTDNRSNKHDDEK